MTNISNLGLSLVLNTGLVNQQNALSQLSEQLSSGQQYGDLTQYTPTQASNIMNFESAITSRQSYLSTITNVQTRLTSYDSSMTDIESMAGQANSLASANNAYNSSTASNILQQAQDYLKQLTDDLNQQVNGRYIYAGTRYNTQPVTDLTTLTGDPTATTTTQPALPSYDADYNSATSFTINSGKTPSGDFTIGDTTIDWSNLEGTSATSPVSVVINGTTQTIAVSGLTTGSAPSDYANNLTQTLNAIAASTNADAAGVPSTFTASASGGAVTMDFGGAAPVSVTPEAGGTLGDITWSGGSSPDGTIAQTPNSSSSAYTLDSALIDTSYNVTYGVSSNDPSFQKLVNGLRYMVSAVNAGQSGDTATYTTDMQQASTLLSDGLSGVQTLHAQVANNQNILTKETTNQNTDITNLQNQLSNIQQVNLTQVGTEINLLTTQLQASYSATASLQKLSLVTYL
jgi:flagellar hook-associated protein 3 FlgL